MSSTMMQSESSIVPTRSIESICPGFPRCLMIIATPASTPYFAISPSRNFFTRYTPPASGDTITGLCSSIFAK